MYRSQKPESVRTKVSVCMAAYNGSKYIEEQISSILYQLHESDELIVVNDCSTDNTVEILESFNDARIKIINNSQNLGVVKSFEISLKSSRGDVIFFSDQDDIWVEDKVKKTLQCLEEQQSLVVVSDAKVFDDSGHIIEQSFFKYRNSGSGLIKNFYKNSYIGCCMAIDAKIKPYVLPFPNKHLLHDEWIGLISEFLGKTSFLPEKLLMYRRHKSNQTNMSRSKWSKVIQKRITLTNIIYFRIIPILIKFKIYNFLVAMK